MPVPLVLYIWQISSSVQCKSNYMYNEKSKTNIHLRYFGGSKHSTNI